MKRSTPAPMLDLSDIDWTKVETIKLQAHDELDLDYGLSQGLLMTQSTLLHRFSLITNADDMEVFCALETLRRQPGSTKMQCPPSPRRRGTGVAADTSSEMTKIASW